MGSAVFPAPAAGSKTRYYVTLLSGTSWTVPTGVTYINATLVGGGGAGGAGYSSGSNNGRGGVGRGGQVVTTSFATTPGASITYAIGAAAGNTTMTGATTATAGNSGGNANSGGNPGTNGLSALNGGNGGGLSNGGGSGGSGAIFIEYWV